MHSAHALLFGGRLSDKELARLCNAVGTMLDAGIDIRKAWRHQADVTAGSARRAALLHIVEQLGQGSTLSDAMEQVAWLFPDEVLGLVRVGEKTGRLPEVLKHLGSFYEQRVARKRQLWSMLAWPLTELGIALVVVGFVIWIMGIIGDPNNPALDPTGLGLVGTKGLLLYVAMLTLVAVAIGFVVRSIQLGMPWVKPLHQLLYRLPGVGSALETLALSRLSWMMYLTLSSGMDVRQAMRLSLTATGHPDHRAAADRVVKAVERGESVYDALQQVRGLRFEFLEAVHTGEQAGRLPEAMNRLSVQFSEQAAAALRILTMAVGWIVWGIVAAIIIMFIFRMAMAYVGTIQSYMP